MCRIFPDRLYICREIPVWGRMRQVCVTQTDTVSDDITHTVSDDVSHTVCGDVADAVCG